MRRGGIQPKLKTFTVKAFLGAKRPGTHRGASGASAKAAAPVDSGAKPEGASPRAKTLRKRILDKFP